MEQNLILDHDQIKHKIKRIAYQIYEANAYETEIYLAGISGNGYIMTKKIADELKNISSLEVKMIEVFVNKNDLMDKISTSVPLENIKDKSIVLIDDVLNSGGVLMYGVRHLLNVPVKKLLTAVLVNRNHKKYPVKADFKGISLSTTLHERVDVEFSNDGDKAFVR